MLSCRELIHFRGEPDPFKGDVPNARVREFSKEVVEVLFNSAPVTNTSNTLAAQVGWALPVARLQCEE
jgi:hypothetical protein